MNAGRNSLLVIGLLIVAFYLWMTSQSTTRGLVKTPAKAKPKSCSKSSLGSLLGGLLKPKKPSSGKSGGGSGGGSGSGSGTAGGKKSCNKTPGFCGCCSNYAYAGKDANGNEIYQKCDGSLVYSDGSPATRCDITCNCGACAGTVCNSPLCNPQCVTTAQPCKNPGAPGGCLSTGCFCSMCCCCCCCRQ
jgi:hypothetical protein